MHIHQEIVVKTRTLDGLITDGVAQLDLIKIDVEEAEYLVLSGGRKLFADGVLGLIEIYDERAFDLLDSYGSTYGLLIPTRRIILWLLGADWMSIY